MHNIQSPRTDDDAVEQMIKAKGLNAPRVTPEDMAANIRWVHYFTAAQGAYMADLAAMLKVSGKDYVSIQSATPTDTPLALLTFCVITLQNGFTVTGESACASPENFDAEIGKKIALENAKQKIWPLMGYALKEKLA